MPISTLLKRLNRISSNGILRRETEKRTIETVLSLQKKMGTHKKAKVIIPEMEKRIQHLEKNPLSAGNDEGKALPTDL